MDSPGLSVRPIIGLYGEHEFNQVFFDGVRAPVDNLVGEENDGWGVAKRLMRLARANNTPSALIRRLLRRAAVAVAAAEPEPALRASLANLEIELTMFEQLEWAALPAGRPRSGDQTAPSMLKLIGSELHQKVTELALEAAGPIAIGGLRAIGSAGKDIDSGARVMAKYLAVRAATINSGASETQRNIMSRQILSTSG